MSVSVTLIAHAPLFSWLLPFWLKCFQSCQSFDPPTLDHSFTMQVVDSTSKAEQNLNIEYSASEKTHGCRYDFMFTSRAEACRCTRSRTRAADDASVAVVARRQAEACSCTCSRTGAMKYMMQNVAVNLLHLPMRQSQSADLKTLLYSSMQFSSHNVHC